MVREFLRVSFFLQELEKANGKVLYDLVSMARLANISLGIMAKAAPRHGEDIDLYFQMRRAIDSLQREANRQTDLLDALKKELIHVRDDDADAVPPCVLFDYENAEVS